MPALKSKGKRAAYAHVQEHTGKQPYFVHLEGEPVMRMAGLFDAWKGEDGELLYTYTIMTTDSSPRLQWCAWNLAMHPCGCSASSTECRGAREVICAPQAAEGLLVLACLSKGVGCTQPRLSVPAG